ncbi:CDC27 [Hepatospora eriocheir]|uniref:CDC27 n=1 Tax=Hepatospora eriocheir TaxID=1081669 RepID=A0A1X0Q884_9MICR|nr:CDC27 [Hepatospora eriocheir]
MNKKEIQEKLLNSYKYRDYETSIFLATHLYSSEATDSIKLLLGVLYYEKKDYKRSITFLKNLNTITALFYTTLDYYELKRYKEGLTTILKLDDSIINDDVENNQIGTFLKNNILLDYNISHIENLKAKIYKALGDLSNFITSCKLSMTSEILYEPVNNLFNEKELKVNGTSIIECFYSDLMLKSDDKKYIDHYKKCVPGKGSYALSKIAVENEDYHLFSFLRLYDESFIEGVEDYSTILFRKKKKIELVNLALYLTKWYPNDHRTWMVIGNYYSLIESDLAVKCLMKSKDINETYQVYSLLGFEAASRCQYRLAESFYNSSLKLRKNNHKALFGLGITLDERFQYKNALMYFMKALELNETDKEMQVYFLRFLIKHKKYEKGLNYFISKFNFENNIDLIIDRLLNSIGYNETEELMILEFIEIIYNIHTESKDKISLVVKLLDNIKIRSSSYYKKRALLELNK